MKVFTASINLTLRTTKTLSDGTHPIMLRAAWNGTKEVSTHFSCNVKDWDKKNQCLKKTFPNASAINGILQKLKAEAIERRTRFEASGEPYTAAMLLAPSTVEIAPLKRYKEVMEAMINDNHLSYNTARRHRSTASKLEAFVGHTVECAELRETDLRRFADRLKKDGLSDGTIRANLSCIQAVLSYAVEKKVITVNPLVSWNYAKKLKTPIKNGYIHYTTLGFMKKHMEMILKDNGSIMFDKKDKHYPLWLFMTCILMQGLAPVDMFKLERSQMTVKHINGKNYYCIDTKRSKTSVPVKIRILQDDYSDAMIRPLMHINRSHWLIPILEGIDPNDDKKLMNRISYELAEVNKGLKLCFGEINMAIQKKHLNIPHIDSGLTFYAARHSYAMAFMAKGGSPIALATLLGRSVDSLSAYVEQLTAEDDLVNAVSIM